MATCMAAAEATYPSVYKGRDIQPMEGQNLLPVLDGKDRSDRIYFGNMKEIVPCVQVIGN